ncbi:MAG: hypothetical protein M0C28_40105 [Candidatus Moduliflexus flocculans]|nr:hypothetical protein [Candidatus Moduliflexus flocculans]
MKPSTLQQEVTIIAPTPTVDVVRSSTSQTITSDVLATLPLGRNVGNVLAMAPGAVGGSVHGDGRGEVGAVMDGIQMSEPDVGGVAFGYDVGIAWDMVEEFELVTAGATAQFFNSTSGLTNVLMKSGSNKFSGSATVYYTDKNLAQIHLPEPDLQALNLAKPSVPVYSVDDVVLAGRSGHQGQGLVHGRVPDDQQQVHRRLPAHGHQRCAIRQLRPQVPQLRRLPEALGPGSPRTSARRRWRTTRSRTSPTTTAAGA